MICNECGSTRVGDAKFCGECGSKFELSEAEIFELEQQKILKTINKRKNNLTDFIIEKTYDNRKLLVNQYIQYINSVRTLLDFNEKNADIIVDLIMDTQDYNELDSDAFFAQLFNKLRKENSHFEHRLDEIAAISNSKRYTKEMFDFQEYYSKNKEFLIKWIEDYKRMDKNSRSTHQENIKNLNTKLESLEICKELYDKQKLAAFLAFRIKFADDEFSKEEFIKKNKININTENEPFKNDVIDLVDAALAFTSPISATRYILKMMKS
ncbi:hypothetical protein [Bacillus sp. CD3-1a]|uniref:hypothetical protein n=1 Tax=Bacillus sp. CD3-1a TaxID=2587158 RepID=UPI0011215A32|nr:hypothetical protein [Bacillus sp. CD3-1a]TNO92957.1 hypothetical protein FH038_24570 [Bacillus sp. CD3-1a]